MYSSSSPLSKDDLDRAFTEGHFAAVFQPKLSLIDGRTLGVEAFVRWHHPELGTLLPGEFLSFVADAGRMDDLTDMILHEAARVASYWRSQRRHWTVTVNLGASDLDNESLPKHLADLLTAYAIPAEAIAIDVPEAAIAEDPEKRLAALRPLRELGIHIALDASGMDLLPLEMITATHFTELKMGGSAMIKFARSVERARKGLIAERLEAATSHGLSVTATRIEDIETLKPLAEMGFDAAQGTFFRHPDTVEGLETWSSDWLIPVLTGERPPRADTLDRARATISDPDLLLMPADDDPVEEDRPDAAETDLAEDRGDGSETETLKELTAASS